MAHHHHEGDTKKFTLIAFLSFAIVFCLLLLMAQCHGPFHPAAAHAGGGEHATEHKAESSHEEVKHEAPKAGEHAAPEHEATKPESQEHH